MTYQYDNTHHKPPAPVVLVTVRNPTDGAKQATIDALLDTGADIPCLPESLIKAIGGEPAGTCLIYGVGGLSAGERKTYFLEFEIASIIREVVELGDEPILGRNLINQFVLQLDGPSLKLSIITQ